MRGAREGKIQYKEENKRKKVNKAPQQRTRIRKGEKLKQNERRMDLEK